ncbi:MAG: ABC transporter substrate-binding protein [Marvinbryantia sp.]|jgi:peptide/nickel transport system substrate-binding protein
MKKKLMALLLAVSMVASLPAAPMVSAESTETEMAEKTAEKHVEVLKIGTTKPADAFNIMTEDGSYGKMNYNSFCAAPYIQRGQDGALEPFIMTDWEISDDQTSLVATFATDQGITWHDGEPLTIDDIVFSLEYMVNVKQSSYTTGMTTVEKIDDKTVKINFDGPKAFGVLNSMAKFTYIYPKHIWEGVEDYKAYTGEDAMIGCGPYKVTDIDQDAQVVTYEKVADTYLGREITVDKVQVRSYDSHDSLVMALKNGEIDAMYDYSNSLDSSMQPSITGVEGLDAGMSTNTGNFQLVFGFNVAPTNDLNFRKAVSKALDYELLAATIGGADGEIAGTGVVSSAVQGFNPDLPKNAQDVEAAKASLDEGGYVDINGDGLREMPDGSEMDVLVTPQYNSTRAALYARIAEIIIQNLADVGVKASLDEESVRNSDHCTEFRKSGQYELYIGYTSPGVATFDSAFMYMTPNPANPWGTCNITEFNEKYDALVSAGSQEEYNAILQELQVMAADNVIGIGLCWDKAYFPYRTDKIGGWINFTGFGAINAETWYSLYTK